MNGINRALRDTVSHLRATMVDSVEKRGKTAFHIVVVFHTTISRVLNLPGAKVGSQPRSPFCSVSPVYVFLQQNVLHNASAYAYMHQIPSGVMLWEDELNSRLGPLTALLNRGFPMATPYTIENTTLMLPCSQQQQIFLAKLLLLHSSMICHIHTLILLAQCLSIQHMCWLQWLQGGPMTKNPALVSVFCFPLSCWTDYLKKDLAGQTTKPWQMIPAYQSLQVSLMKYAPSADLQSCKHAEI